MKYRWKNYEFRTCGDYKYELVYWEDTYCFTIAFFIWDKENEVFNFESVNLRFLEYYSNRLNEWILAFIELKKIELEGE